MSGSVRYRKNGERHGLVEQCPEWDILYNGIKIGTCHRRDEASAGYYGAWVMSGLGYRRHWTDSRQGAGLTLSSTIKHHLALLEHYDEVIRYKTTDSHAKRMFGRLTALGLCMSVDGMDDHDEDVLYVWPRSDG